jgi:hypothetical protein
MLRLQVAQPDLAHFCPFVQTVGGGARPTGLTQAYMRMAFAANSFSLLGGILYGLLGLVLNLPYVVPQS